MVLLGDIVGQLITARLRRTAPAELSPVEATGHIDLQDDLLLVESKDQTSTHLP
jgi:hypothetical protein